MDRGLPAVWSFIIALPFIGSGGYLLSIARSGFELAEATLSPSDLQLSGSSLIVFGSFIFIVGLYVQFVSPEEPRLQENENLIDYRNPSQRVAASKLFLSIPFLGLSTYLLFFTVVPYVYPTIALAIGLFLFSSGIKTYWANTLTSFYITSKRVISEYRFISLRRKEIPLTKVRAVEERRSIMEVLTGLGNVRIASGGGGGSVRITIHNISNSTQFADEIRGLIN